jgi:predicted Zn finger-like uncharacterized protein
MLARGTAKPGNGGKEQAAGGTMRLTCPNCGAQYEVPDAVIPESGRDVQCSNCGTTWWQHHPDHTPPEPPEAEPDPAPEPEADPDPHPDTAPNAAPSAQRRLDPSVADILREEADRERAARAAEADGRIETQPDLGLGEPESEDARRAREARERMQRLRGQPAAEARPAPRNRAAREDIDDDEDDTGDIDPGSRRNLFPDIEEINSSLSASGDAAGSLAPALSDEIPPPRRGGRFRTGFRLAVATCLIALAIYLLAPSISALLPAARAPLAQYVQAVDEARALLLATITGLLALL